MFHLFSKLLSFFVSPLTWVIIILIAAFWSKNTRRKTRLLLIGIITLYLFSNRFLINEAILLWEVPVNSIESSEKYDYAIILGGYSVYDPDWDRIEFIGAADRLFAPLQMYQQGQLKNLILTGGAGNLEHPERKEAIGVKDFLTNIGVREKNILVESNSKNTHENALFTKQLIDSLGIADKKFLLVTSSTHLRRAKGCFEKEHINFDVLSVDKHSAERSFHYTVLFIPSSDALNGWYYLFHEFIGYISYWLAGYL